MKPFVEEILDDIIQLDPDLQKVKKDLEHLIKELIKNKPETPFTKEFKESLKAQIVGAINEQKILYEEKNRDWKDMFHNIKFWMYSMSSIAVALIFFIIFQNIEQTNIPQQDIIVQTFRQNVYEDSQDISENPEKISENPQEISKISSTDAINRVSTNKNTINQASENTQQIPEIIAGNGASESADNVMMTVVPEMNSKLLNSMPIDNTSKILCKTSEQFLSKYNLTETSDNTSKIFTYNNQQYKANINFTNNTISIYYINNHINTQDNMQNQTEIPNLNIFFKNNGFDIAGDYNSAIIEENDKTIEYYYPNYEQKEGITVIVDKTTNTIFSIDNICIYK